MDSIDVKTPRPMQATLGGLPLCSIRCPMRDPVSMYPGDTVEFCTIGKMKAAEIDGGVAYLCTWQRPTQRTMSKPARALLDVVSTGIGLIVLGCAAVSAAPAIAAVVWRDARGR